MGKWGAWATLFAATTTALLDDLPCLARHGRSTLTYLLRHAIASGVAGNTAIACSTEGFFCPKTKTRSGSLAHAPRSATVIDVALMDLRVVCGVVRGCGCVWTKKETEKERDRHGLHIKYMTAMG